MQNSATATCLQNNLPEIIFQISFLLKEWENGDQCFMSLQEAQLLQLYFKNSDEVLLAAQLNISCEELLKKIQYLTLKIQFNHRQYKMWCAGLIPHIFIYPPFMTYDNFLSVPLHTHKFSARFYNVLISLYCTTIKDVLKFSVGQLLTYRNVGEQSIRELKNSLAQQDCCHLLME